MNISDKNKLFKILDDCWLHYQEHKDKNYIVEKCVPVLYFGNLEKHLSSDIKIVTAASNPSNLEFGNADRRNKVTGLSFRRFSGCEEIYDLPRINSTEKEIYLNSLSNYFESKEAFDWFTCYEPLLNGLEASYSEKGFKVRKNEPYRRKKYERIAIHTDIYSPLPTKKPWSEFCRELPSHVVKDVKLNGLDLWIELIKLLAPNVILMSYSIPDFEDIKKQLNLKKMDNGLFKEYPNTKDGQKRKRSVPVIETYELEIDSKKITVIYGTKMERPFDAITKIERFELGKEIGGIL